MKLDLSANLKSFDGKVLDAPDGKPATLKSVLIEALMAVFNDEQTLSGEEKLKRYLLAERVYKGESDFAHNEIALMKVLVGKAYSAIIVGQVWKMLEGEK